MNVVVMASGSGSNLDKIINELHLKNIINITLVICDKNCGALKYAQDAGIPAIYLPYKKNIISPVAYDEQLLNIIKNFKYDLIVLAGYMRIIKHNFIDNINAQIINLHPSILPKHKGLNTFKKALDAGDKSHGSTVHIVNKDLDSGTIIANTIFGIEPNDDVESLKEKTKKLEHKLYPWVISNIANKNIVLKNNDVYYNQEKIVKPINYKE